MVLTLPSLAKLERPAASGLLPRERLFALLDQGCQGTIVWISAPPGSGKTSLVASYLAARDCASVWYQVDTGDADLASFFHYLGLAASRSPGQPLPHLRPEYLSGLETFTRRFFREFFGRFPTPFVWVLDNYQEVPADAAFHQMISTALSELPAGNTAILIGRGEPPPTLARWYASSGLTVIDADALRLTEQELTQLAQLRGYEGDDVAGGALGTIAELTRGWAAGVVLLLRARAQGLPMPTAVDRLQPWVRDYFAAEVLRGIPPAVRDLLLQTACLPIVPVSVAVRLSGMEEAGAVLAGLHRRRFFIEQHGELEAAYRYHPLFRGFLLSQAAQTFSAQEFAQLRRCGAHLLEVAGHIEAAAQLFSEGTDWANAGRMICTHAPALIAQGRHRTQEDWIGRIPAAETDRMPWVLYWLGTSRAIYSPPEGRAYLERAFERFQGVDNVAGQFLSCSGIMMSFFLQWGDDCTPMERWVGTIEGLVRRHGGLPPEVEVQVISGALGLLFRCPQHPLLQAWCDRAIALVCTDLELQQRLTLGNFAALYLLWRGDLARMAMVLEGLRPAVEHGCVAPLNHIHWCVLRSACLWHGAAHDEASKVLDEALRMADESGVHTAHLFIYAHQILTALSVGDVPAAEQILARASPLLNSACSLEVLRYQFLRAGIKLLAGEVGAALTIAQPRIDEAERLGVPFFASSFRIQLAQMLMLDGQLGAAVAHLEHAIASAGQISSAQLTFKGLVALAYCEFQAGHEAAGVAALQAACKIGREHNYMNCHPWWLPEVMSQLCARALQHGIEVDYVVRLIRTRGLMPASLEVEGWPWTLKIYTLGRCSVVKGDMALRPAYKGQRKVLDLLKALIALGGREVSSEALIDALWPDADGDTGRSAFYTTLHRLRKLLGNEHALKLSGGRLDLDAKHCWVDIWALERCIGQTLALSPNTGELALLRKHARRLLDLYQGPFLGRGDTTTWAMAERERLRIRFLRAVKRLGDGLEAAGAWNEAVVLYEHALDAEPLAEDLYRRLMKGYLGRGHNTEVTEVYRRCSAALSHAGLPVSAECDKLYRAALRGRLAS